MTPPPVAAALLREVDALVRQGALAAAADALEAGFAGHAPVVLQWLQLAGLRRALRQPHRAMTAVQAALALAPLDFMALVMRAGLLEALGDDNAGQAWDEALAQRPAVPLSGALAQAAAAGEQTRDRWLAARAARLAEAAASAEQGADADVAWRIARFRDNTLRRTRVWHSAPTHFHYPGLIEREFHPRAAFPWLADVEAETAAIRAEFVALAAAGEAEAVAYVRYPAHEALAQWRALNHNRDWTALHLLAQGARVAANADRCPVTMAVLGRLPQPAIAGASPNAMFSVLAPRTAIPPHVGVNNARLVCHLPLIVPAGCWFRVGAETRLWRERAAFVFDDTIEHEALNPSDEVRVVLIFDVWHPGLSAIEQAAVAAMIAADGATTVL
jgi:aspartyl/asparaginyl beta-hydroxylase (cupin superfamily)